MVYFPLVHRKVDMPGKFRWVFLAAVLVGGANILLPSLRGDRRTAGAARGEGINELDTTSLSTF